MLQLADIQSAMRQALVAGDETGIRPLLFGGSNHRTDATRRLEIHRRHYETSLGTALLGRFPATLWLVGSQFVTKVARRYVRKHPPQRPCIAEYGEGFPEFLCTHPAAERVPYLREFAELEWRVGQVAIAIDHTAVTIEEFSMIPAEALPKATLTLQPGLRYFQAAWPVDTLMKLYLTEAAPDSFEFEPEDVWIEVQGARGEFRIGRLTPGEFMFRKCIFEGRPISDAAEGALDAEADFDPVTALAPLVANHLIISIKSQVQEGP